MITGEQARKAASTLRAYVEELEPERFPADAAVEALDFFIGVERTGAAGALLMSRRIEQINVHRQSGDRDAGAFVARRTGESVGRARNRLQAARDLEHAPHTDAAFRAGELSADQAREAAATERVSPRRAKELIKSAPKLNATQFRERAERLRRESAPEDENERAERLHKGRYLRLHRNQDGSGTVEIRTTPDLYARFKADIEAEAARIMDEARQAGVREPYEAYRHDAAIRLFFGGATAGASTSGARAGGDATVHVHVDLQALRRGCAQPGEACEIDGVGPVSVAVARRLLGDGILKILVKKGRNVVTVAHAGRTVPAHLRTALEFRDRVCVVDRCDVAQPLEIHHLVTPFCAGGELSLDNAVRLCPMHHDLITYRGFALVRNEDGSFRLAPPDGDRTDASDPDAQWAAEGGHIIEHDERLGDPPGVGALF